MGSKLSTIQWAAIGYGAGAMSQSFNEGVQSFASYEQGLADLQAITGIAGKDLAHLGETARQVGKESGLGATQATEAFKLLASQISVDKIGISGLKQLQKQTILLAQAQTAPVTATVS